MANARDRRQQGTRKSVQREERRTRHQTHQRRRRWLYLGASGVIGVLITVSLFLPSLPGGGTGGTGATSYKNGVGDPQAVMPTASHLDGQTIEYSTTPPTSGDHWAAPAQCGFYEEEMRDETIVHNMEHGHIIMSYNLTDPSDLSRLKDVHNGLEVSDSWLVTRPYSEIPEGDIAMTAWGVLDQFTGIDEELIQRFFDAYKGNRFSDETSSIGRGIACR